MILIIAPIAEKTINDVLDWFHFLGKPFARIIPDEPLDLKVNITDNEIKIYINDIDENQISTFWVRKGHFTHSTIQVNQLNEILAKQLVDYLNFEFGAIATFVIHQLECKQHLGNYFERVPNKLQHLKLAQESGLSVPKTLITQSKDKLLTFQGEVASIITKSIQDFYNSVHDSFYYYNHTERVTAEALADMPDTFFPTQVQEELPKAYELRIVFVCQRLYTMAIFSQNDTQTSVDWRNYNRQKPNRTVPYLLPPFQEAAVLRFIEKSGLNIGAIDMIVTTDKRYVFLECNPNGQINMVSENCNYLIEKDIAYYLAYGKNLSTQS